MLTFTQLLANKAAFEKAKARPVTVTVTGKRPKWAFHVLAYAGGKVEVFDDYDLAGRWCQAVARGGVVYPRDLVADYTATSVTLKDGMPLHEPEVEHEPAECYFGA